MLTAEAKPDNWYKYDLCSSEDLNCFVCLGDGGQAFTWENLDDCTWMNVIEGYPVIIRAQEDRVWLYSQSEDAVQVMRDYLRLNDNLKELCEEWSSYDSKFPTHLPGIRLLRQDPLETLFAFICSQNNVIQRIRSMVRSLKVRYGTFIGSFGSPFEGDDRILQFYAFPSDAGVLESCEAELRELKFGYRAKYIASAAQFLRSQDLETSSKLKGLRYDDYDSVTEKLRAIPGVGPKVADCIALMSLDQLGAVPIDTHIWRIARERYGFAVSANATKTMNDKIYRAIGDKFRSLFGSKAGWAHSVLFTAELKKTKKSLQ